MAALFSHPIKPADQDVILALNNAHAAELSWLEPAELSHLVGQAFLARRVGAADAFLLAFDQDADYASPNFLWFKARQPVFVYVDRIVVAPAARGRGLAGRLYDALFDAARRAGHTRIACEVNVEPPNPGSHAFHEAMGFSVVGDATLAGGKAVRYYLRAL